LNGKAQLFEAAIAPHEGVATMYVSRREDSSSLLPIGTLQSEIFPGTELKETRLVRTATLDEFLTAHSITAPALLKIDVQGFEIEVLKGAASLLDMFQYIYMECSFIELYTGQALVSDIIIYLERRGFRLAGFYNQVEDKTGRPVQADFLFSSVAINAT
jgi:FkbM family methyltransferase